MVINGHTTIIVTQNIFFTVIKLTYHTIMYMHHTKYYVSQNIGENTDIPLYNYDTKYYFLYSNKTDIP